MRRLVLICALCLAAPLVALAQVAHVSSVSNGTVAAGTTVTLSSVVGSGGNLLLICAGWENATSQTLNTPTYGGSATGVTLIHDGLANERAAALYYLANPAGTADVVLTTSASTARLYGTAMVFSGVNTSSPISDSDETPNDSTGTAPSLSLTTSADEFVASCLIRRGTNETISPTGTGHSQAGTQSSGSISIYHKAGTADGSGGGTLGWSWASGSDYYMNAVALAADAGGVAPRRGRLLMGCCQ